MLVGGAGFVVAPIAGGDRVVSARWASTRPKVTPAIGTALCSSALATWAGVALGTRLKSSPAIPLTTGAAEDVPRKRS